MGGKFAGVISKLGRLAKTAPGKITKGFTKATEIAEKGMTAADRASTLMESGISTAEQLTGRAEALAERTSSIGQQVGDIYTRFSGRESDSNYSDTRLINSAPLSPRSGQNFQSFGDYICLKKDFVQDMRMLFNELFAKRNDV